MASTAELHRRKIFAGIAMIAAPLTVGAAYLIAPASSGDTAETVTAMAEGAGRVEASSFLLLAGIALFVYATMGLVHLLREERPWTGQIGGVLAITGFVFLAGLVGIFLTVTQVAEADVATGVALMQGLEDSAAFMTLMGLTLAVTVGLVVLAVGLAVAKTAPAWSAWLLGLGALLDGTAGLVESDVLAIVGMGIVFLALAPLGYELIVEPDEAWEHPAHFEGFRPVVGSH